MRYLILAALLFLGMPGGLGACLCVGVGSVDEEVRDSDAVFRGQVVEVRPAETRTRRAVRWLGDTYYQYFRSSEDQLARLRAYSWGPEYGLLVTIQVHRSWKGLEPGRVVLRTGFGQGDCGFRFDEGMTYLVYASVDHSTEMLATSICSRTAPIHLAAGDIRMLEAR